MHNIKPPNELYKQEQVKCQVRLRLRSRLVVFVKFKNSLIHSIYNVARGNLTAEYRRLKLRLLFSLKPKEMAKMRLLAIWIEVKL